MPILEYDKDATDRLLSIYTTPDVETQRKSFIKALNPEQNQRILDVGSGPGFLANDISQFIGRSGQVCGIDISKPLLDIANSNYQNRSDIEFHFGDATKIPYKADDFDAVVSTQVLEYVPDVDAALLEFQRVLKPGGKVALLDTDWDSIVWHSSDMQRMNRVLKVWEEHASDPFLPRTLGNRLSYAGFTVESQEIIPIYNAEFNEDTYSNRLIDLIVPFVVNSGKITTSEAKTWAKDLRERGQNGEYFFSLNRYFFLAK
jgi:arsenite methyltransferase